MSNTSPDLDDKRIFLVVCPDEGRRDRYTKWIETHIGQATVFGSHDGADALFKIDNVPPQVLIAEADLPKLSGIDLVERLLHRPEEMSIVLLSPLPDREHFVDDVVRGKVQILVDFNSEEKFNECLTKALNRLTLAKDNEYRLHFLTPGQVLFREREIATSVYFVKRGRMQAYKGMGSDEVALGEIQNGEFVGEMAHINHEPRSASVRALEDCELIEIPNGSLDLVLFSKPVWAQALMRTLSKRLKRSNETLAKLIG